MHNVIPGRAVDNIKLGMSIDEVRRQLGQELKYTKYPLGTEYALFGQMEVWFNNGVVTQVSPQNDIVVVGYEDIQIGVHLSDIQDKYELVYNEEGFWESDNIGGILFVFENAYLKKVYVEPK